MRWGGTGENFRKRTKDAIYRRQGGRCHDQLGCGSRMTRKKMETHHVIKKSWGGSAHSWNGAGMHKRCHAKITKNQRRSGTAGVFSGSLELVKEGNLVIKQDKLYDNIYIKEK